MVDKLSEKICKWNSLIPTNSSILQTEFNFLFVFVGVVAVAFVSL